MPILSIIVPVYNKERFIDECIQSILNQTLTDFELILVNDGSTDGSYTVCKKFAERDSRIRLIDQRNGGASAARNKGIDNANGKYIGFIDADDTIEPDMYELLIRNAEAGNADISVCRLQVFFPNKRITPSQSAGVKVLNHTEALVACLRGDLDRSANNKIYRREVIKDIRFEGHIYEDILYTCKTFLAANKTVFENVVKYNYLVRENSASMSAFNPRYLETIAVSKKMVELVGQKDKDVLIEAQKFDVVANISLLNLLLLVDRDPYEREYDQVVKTLKDYRHLMNNMNGLAAKHKIAFKLFSISPKLYTRLMHWYCVITGAEVVKRTQTVSEAA